MSISNGHDVTEVHTPYLLRTRTRLEIGPDASSSLGDHPKAGTVPNGVSMFDHLEKLK